MTAGSPTIQDTSPLDMQVVLAVVFGAALVLGGLLLAGQAGMLPKSPTRAGADPAARYPSPQTLGERAADQ